MTVPEPESEPGLESKSGPSSASASTLTVSVNGESMDVPVGTVRTLLDHLGIGVRHVAVERNRNLVAKAEFESTVLAAGDVLELVTLVGGG